MALDCQLESSSRSGAFTVTYSYGENSYAYFFSCDTFFAQIRYDAVMPKDYCFGGSCCGATFTMTYFSGETKYA